MSYPNCGMVCIKSWVVPHIYITHSDRSAHLSCRSCDVSFICHVIHVTCHSCESDMNEYKKHVSVMNHIRNMFIFTHMNESWHTCERVTSHIKTSHVTPVETSPHTYEWIVVHLLKSVIWRMRMSHGMNANESYLACRWVVSHVRMSHVMHANESHATRREEALDHVSSDVSEREKESEGESEGESERERERERERRQKRVRGQKRERDKERKRQRKGERASARGRERKREREKREGERERAGWGLVP